MLKKRHSRIYIAHRGLTICLFFMRQMSKHSFWGWELMLLPLINYLQFHIFSFGLQIYPSNFKALPRITVYLSKKNCSISKILELKSSMKCQKIPIILRMPLDNSLGSCHAIIGGCLLINLISKAKFYQYFTPRKDPRCQPATFLPSKCQGLNALVSLSCAAQMLFEEGHYKWSIFQATRRNDRMKLVHNGRRQSTYIPDSHKQQSY